MRIILFFILLVAAATAYTQSAFPVEKVRYNVGFMSSTYEIGDKDVTEAQLLTHFQQYDANAFYYLKKAKANDNANLIGALVGLGGIIVGVASKSNTAKIAGYGIATLGFTLSIATTIGASNNREKSVKSYNSAHGF